MVGTAGPHHHLRGLGVQGKSIIGLTAPSRDLVSSKDGDATSGTYSEGRVKEQDMEGYDRTKQVWGSTLQP